MCHLWNLVEDETREGDVYRKLLEKLEQARQSLGGQVFDVLGKLHFEGRPLREPLSANMTETLTPLGITVGRWRVRTHERTERLDDFERDSFPLAGG